MMNINGENIPIATKYYLIGLLGVVISLFISIFSNIIGLIVLILSFGLVVADDVYCTRNISENDKEEVK